MTHTIGRTYSETESLDWNGWYPVVAEQRGEIVIVAVIPADLDDTSDFVPVSVTIDDENGDEINPCEAGWQDAFMRAADYRAMFEAQDGGAA